MRKVLIVLLVLFASLFVLTLVFGGFISKKSESISPNILYLTQPVTSFSGKVERIEGKTVLVSNQYSLPQIKTITYRLLVTDKTQISQSLPPINYLLKTVTPAPAPKLTIKNIKVGQYVNVNSQVDLRTLANDTFEAATIILPPFVNALHGKIVSVTNNTLTLKSLASAPQEKEYRITINHDTEISRSTGSNPEKLAFSDLKKDMEITVYTAEDVTESQTLMALRIEPPQTSVNINPSSIPLPSASASPSTKP